jgi:hypothetical protein
MINVRHAFLPLDQIFGVTSEGTLPQLEFKVRVNGDPLIWKTPA